MDITRKTTLLSASLISVMMIACADTSAVDETTAPAVETVAEASTPAMDAPAMDDMSHDDMETLPREYRLAFMMGHVEAGLSLYRAGEPEMAAPHLLHPVSETHASEREGLDVLGFNADLFETVSDALKSGTPASDVEPQLAAAEDNLRMVAMRAGGDPAGIIRFLMDTLLEEYEIAITDGVVTDPGEYQDAYGFAVVATDRAAGLDASVRSDVIAALDELTSLWPDGGPIPPDAPTSVAEVTIAVSNVVSILPNAD